MKKYIFISLASILILSSCVPTYVWDKTSVQHIPKTQEEDFSIIVIPDTQFAVQNFPSVFMQQIDWIVQNIEKINIKAVVHLGDQVNVARDEKQWKTFDTGIKKLDEKNMPVLLALGNHDHPSDLYNRYFPVSRYEKKYWWGGNMGEDTENKYLLLDLSGEKYIFLSLDFCPKKEEIAWGNEILNKYKDYKVFFVTHAFLDKNGGRNPHVCKNTEYIWTDFVQLHKNLQIVVSGHVHSESRRTDKNLAGKNVYQMLSDFQEEDYGGNGWLRIMTFSPKHNNIKVRTYSPFLDRFQEDNQSQFELHYPME